MLQTENHPKAISFHPKGTDLTDLSGIILGLVQTYKQGDQDIMKAEVQTVFVLARVLGCAAEVVCGWVLFE